MAPYTEYHPRWHRVRMSTYWWLGRWPYLKFILRELSSVFVAWTVFVLLFLIKAVGDGPDAYAAYLNWLGSPFALVANGVSFFFLLFHSLTWFALAPKAMQIRTGGKRIPDILIAGPNYAAWILVSAALIWLLASGNGG